MCIGTPMTLLSVDGLVARAATRAGEERTISLALTGGGEVGTWVLVHLDTAIRPLEAEEAGLIADALDGLAASLRGESFDHLFADLIGRTPELPHHLRTHVPGGTPEPTTMHRPGEAAE